MKCFLIQGEEGPVAVIAAHLGVALKKWRRWMVDQSDGAVSELAALEIWPEGIQEVADEVIL